VVGINTATAGAKSGTVVVGLTSDGTGSSGLGNTSLTAQTITVTAGNVYRFAAANTVGNVTLPNVHVGGTFGTSALTVKNTAANDGFSEKLDASVIGLTGFAGGNGSINLLAGNSTDNSSIVVDLGGSTNTSSAGAVSGTVTLGLTSDGTATSGLGNTSLANQTVTVSGSVYRLAAPSTISSPITFGNFHVGAVATQALSLTNTDFADGFSEKLDAAFTGASGNTTGSGTITLLGPTLTDSTHLVVTLNTSTVGAKSGSVTVGLTSDGNGTSGLGNSSLTSQTITVNAGTVYRLASANTIPAVAFGNVHQGATANQLLSVTNTAASDGFSEMLNASVGGATGNATASGSFASLLAPQATNSTDLTVGLNTSTLGNVSGNATVTLSSNGNGTSGLGITALANQTVSVSGSVYSGQSTWTNPNTGNWGTTALGFGTNWGTNQGSPGLDPNFPSSDTATFNSGFNATTFTVNLNGASPSLKAITLNDTFFGTYTIAQGSGGTLHLNGGNSTATVTNSAASNTISAPIELDSSANFSVASGLTLTVSGAVSQSGTASLTMSNSGTLTLSNTTNTYTGPTTVSGGTLKLSAAATNNIGNSSAITVGTGATLNVTGLTGGTIVLSPAAGTAHTGGQVLAGIGTVTGNVTVAGGAIVAPGTSTALGTGSSNTVGNLTTSAKETWGSNGEFSATINAATGTPGTNWVEDRMQTLSVTATGADANHEFYIAPVATLTNLAPDTTFTWVIGNVSSGGATGTGGALATATNLLGSSAAAPFALDTSNFSATVAGEGSSPIASSFFTVELITSGGGENIQLQFTTTPEPGTTLLVTAGVLPMLLARRRRKNPSGQPA